MQLLRPLLRIEFLRTASPREAEIPQRLRERLTELDVGISVILGLGGGLVVDNWLGTLPLFTLVGVVLGIGAAMYTIWDVARDAMRR